MYEAFYALNERPFSLSPDPRFFFLSAQHREALAKCQYTISERMGLAAVFGDIGMGKTTIARRLLQQFIDDPSYDLAILVHPNFPSPFQFVRQIRREFGQDKPHRSLTEELNGFQHFLIEQHRQGKTTVLFVDEAQSVKPPLLEVLRQLLNFETTTQKLLQIVLFGQNQLAVKLDRFPSVKDRVSLFAALTSLNREDTDSLIDFRWKVAGGKDQPFGKDALEAIYRYSAGRPRQLCKLCDNALVRAFTSKLDVIGVDVIDHVARDIRVSDESPTPETEQVPDQDKQPIAV